MELDLLIQVLAGLIIAAIVGAFTSFVVLYRCVHKQAGDMKIMKKATRFVLRRLVKETRSLHPEEQDEIEDLEKTYRDLVEDNK